MRELLLALALAAAPPPEQVGDAIPAEAVRNAVLAESYRYLALKDKGDYPAAYALLAPAMRAYLTPELFRSTAATFNAQAGAVQERRVTRLTWERDPPGAPEPGLYVAVDFTARFPNIHLMCGYLMWKQQPDGGFRIVREEQSVLDTRTARQMTPERLKPLPQQFGCVG